MAATSDLQSQTPAKAKKPSIDIRGGRRMTMKQLNNAVPLIFNNCSMESRP